MNWELIAKELRQKTKGKILLREPMKNHTTFRIGGPADLLVTPAFLTEIPELREFAKQKGLPFTLLGNGSNILVRDGGIPGLVVKLGGGPKGVKISEGSLVAEAGTLMPYLAREAGIHSLSGLEFMIGIPGSVGGGVVMNAGAHGQTMDQVVTKIEVIGSDGVSRSIAVGALDLGYRKSALINGDEIVTQVYFQLSLSEKELIKKKMDSHLEFRRIRQPYNWPSAGSVFVNPVDGAAAGYLLDMVGAKGITRGGAQVSEKHANFMINLGEATAQDVLQLIEELQLSVVKKFGVELELEIQVLGEELQSRG